MSEAAAISVRELVKDYGETRAIHGLSFEVARGEFFGLLGPNGAGKSTLLNILAGLTRPSAGQASVCGFDVVSDFRRSRRNLGVVPQELVFDSFFRLEDVVRIQAGYFGLADAREWTREVLERLSLWEHRHKFGRQLSGGMKRRLLIAKALVHRPPVVILDEPTAGVDVALRQQLWDFVREIHRAGTTILLTTHYLEEAEAHCERIGILGQGRLLALAATEELLAKLTDRRVILRLGRRLERVPEALASFRAELDAGGEVLSLASHGTEDRARLWSAILEAGVPVCDVEVERPDLEDVFLDLTRTKS